MVDGAVAVQYRYRISQVQAMYMDGTADGANAVIAWVRGVVPEIVIRQRIEYRGWGDLVGHIELEIQDVEEHCGIADWIVVVPDRERSVAVRVVDDRTFHDQFELHLD